MREDMAICKHKGCQEEALYKSGFCWEHIQDKEKYKKRILRPGKDGKINLEGANLKGADLEGADLQQANLRGANLLGANLRGAGLWMAYLRRADLLGANLREADLWKANLREAYLRLADLGEADLRGAYLERAYLGRANLRGADLRRVNLLGANLMEVNLEGANLENANLRNANLNEADLSEAILTGAKIWGISHAGCKTDGIKAECLNFDKDGEDSGIVHLNKEQAEEFFSSEPTIEILLQDRLTTSAIRTLSDLIDRINQQKPDWRVQPRKIMSSNLLSEVTVSASRDEILEDVANAILGAFEKEYQQKLLEYSPDKKATEERALMLRELGEIKNKIKNPVERVTIIHSTGKIPVNVELRADKMDIRIFGDVKKMINVEGDYYEISAPQGRDDLIRNLIDQLDSPEIEKRVKEAEAQLRGLSTEQVKFLEEQFREAIEKIFKERQKEVGFLARAKSFAQRFSESTFSGVVGSAIWHGVQQFVLPGM